VTGVQTGALPIWLALGAALSDDWVGGRGIRGPLSFPLHETTFEEREEIGDPEAPPAELEDEYEGGCSSGSRCVGRF